MAGILGPYDPPSPCVTTFCRRISKEEYEKQTTETTQQAIADLIKYLEYNPTAYYNILRKRKREDQENEGVFSWLKVKMLSAIHGDDYCEQIDQNEARRKLAALKNEMVEAYDYAEGARGSGVRFSRRLLQKRAKNLKKSSKDNSVCNIDHATSTQEDRISKKLEKDLMTCSIDDSITAKEKTTPSAIPPAPPPPPPLDAMSHGLSKQGCGSNKNQVELLKANNSVSKASQKLSSKSQVKTRSKAALQGKENMNKQDAPDLNNLFKSICDPNLRKTLKPVNIGLTDETPGQIRKRINMAKAATEFPAFNQQLIDKFHNARSPQSPQFLSDVSSPGSFTTSP